MVILGPNRYGKAEVLRDWNVSVSLSGELSAVHLSGDNSAVLPTDTQKNTVYAMAKRLGGIEPEAFALALAEHFVSSQARITRACVEIFEYGWNRLGDHSFARSGGETRTVTVVHDEFDGTTLGARLRDLVLAVQLAADRMAAP